MDRLRRFVAFAHAFLAAMIILVGPAAAQPIWGSVTLQDGRQLRYAYHFDHNALLDCLRIGDSLLALTASGALLRFDARSLAMTGQRIVPGRATAIALGDYNRILIGTEQGIIFETEAATLDFRRIAAFSGRIRWLGSEPGTIVAVLDRASREAWWPGEDPDAFEARRGPIASYAVAVVRGGTNRFFDLPSGDKPFEPYSVLLEGATRLWLGDDGGEFGGSCSWMDLRTGKLRTLPGKPNVLGFLHTRDDRILAYGGTSHLGSEGGYIARVDRRKIEYICEFEGDTWREPAGKEASQSSAAQNTPRGPIDLVLESPSGDGFLAVSEHILYETDRDFRRWKRTAELGGRWRPGRRYSFGATPTVNAAIRDQRSGRWVFAMGRDGFVRVSDGTVQQFKISGQVEAFNWSPLVDIWPTSIGTLLLEGFGPHFGWRLKPDGWNEVSFFPARPPVDPESDWNSAEPLGDDGRGILAYIGDNAVPGERVLVRVSPTRISELKVWTKEASAGSEAFQTADGSIFLISDRELLIWDGEWWRKAGDMLYDWTGLEAPHGRRYVLCGKFGSTEFIHDVPHGALLRLDLVSAKEFRLRPVANLGDVAPGPVFDAVPGESAHILIAAVRGLFRWTPADGRYQRLADPEPAARIQTVCRDSRGRLWAAGDRLHLSYDSGEHWEAVDLPMLCRTVTKRIRPNPEKQDGLILLMHDLGVVYLDW